MRNSIFAIGMLAGALVAAPVFAQADKSKTADTKPQTKTTAKAAPGPNPAWNPYATLHQFKVIVAVDADLDGFISMKEVAGCVERIKKLDVNGDGKLDTAEYLKEAPVGKYAPTYGIVKVIDANKDTELSMEEIDGAVEALKTLDKNKDSKLEPAEYSVASPMSMGGEPRAAGAGVGAGTGVGGGGPGGGGGRQQPSPEEFIKTNDKNSDGKVAKSEMSGPGAGFFDRMDSDKDGFITLEEMKASRERARQNGGGGGGRTSGAAPASPKGEAEKKPDAPKTETPKSETPKADAPK